MREYLTDEELERMIEQLEGRELYAPKHLKEEILNKAFPKQTEQVIPKSKSGGKKPVSLLTYRLKIIAGMAAALIMLVLIPMTNINQGTDDLMRRQKRLEDMEQEYLEGRNASFNCLLNEGARKMDEKINSWFNLPGWIQFND